jgi:hypothetical protein
MSYNVKPNEPQVTANALPDNLLSSPLIYKVQGNNIFKQLPPNTIHRFDIKDLEADLLAIMLKYKLTQLEVNTK